MVRGRRVLGEPAPRGRLSAGRLSVGRQRRETRDTYMRETKGTGCSQLETYLSLPKKNPKKSFLFVFVAYSLYLKEFEIMLSRSTFFLTSRPNIIFGETIFFGWSSTIFRFFYGFLSLPYVNLF